MNCECAHPSWLHSTVTYPKRREPCSVCLRCDRTKPGPGRDCCLSPKFCPCNDFTAAAVPAETGRVA